MSEPDHYATLGVAPDASTEDVHAAWRFSLLAFHPDRFRDAAQRARADDMAKRVNAAWQVLGDPGRRARYDRDRRARRSRREGPPVRELPCPACTTLSGVPDRAGRTVVVRCPACAHEFEAVVGAVLHGRPRLDWRFLGGRHILVLRADDGRARQVAARHLPAELALTEGERVSVVMGPRGARYMVVHGRATDMGWRIG